MTRPVLMSLSFVRTNAPPLPGFTCWKSTTLHTLPSISTVMPLRKSPAIIIGDVPPKKYFVFAYQPPGMGGDTITGILDCGLYDMPEWAGRSDYKLILHPVTKPEILRYWLVNNGFRITRETYVEDNGILYQIICAEPGESEKYIDSELYIGKFERIVNQPCFDAVVDKHIKALQGRSKRA